MFMTVSNLQPFLSCAIQTVRSLYCMWHLDLFYSYVYKIYAQFFIVFTHREGSTVGSKYLNTL